MLMDNQNNVKNPVLRKYIEEAQADVLRWSESYKETNDELKEELKKCAGSFSKHADHLERSLSWECASLGGAEDKLNFILELNTELEGGKWLRESVNEER